MIHFVKAVPEESAILTLICRKSKGYWGYPPELLELWKDELTISENYIHEQNVFKIVKDDQLVGFFALENRVNYFELEHLWITPRFIGLGYGTMTMHHIKTNLIPPQTELQLLADPNAESFYHNHGFITFKYQQSLISKRMLPRMKWCNT